MTAAPSELTRLADAASQRCPGDAVAVLRDFGPVEVRRLVDRIEQLTA